MQALIPLPRYHCDGHPKATNHHNQQGMTRISSPCWQSTLLWPWVLLFAGAHRLQGCMSIMALSPCPESGQGCARGT